MNRSKRFLYILINYLLVIAIIMSTAVMYNYIGVISHPTWTKYYVFIFAALTLLFFKTISKNSIIWVIYFSIFWMIYLIVNPVNPMGVLFLLAIPNIVLFFCFAQNQDDGESVFFHVYSNVVSLISVVTSFFWLFGSILNVLPGRLEMKYNWAEHLRQTFTYFGIYFENPVQNMNFGSISVVRNTGLHTEAPGFCSILIWAFLIEVFVFKRKKRMLLLVFTLLTTFSTKAYGVLLLVLLYYVYTFVKRDGNHSLKVLIQYFSLITICIMVVVGVLILNHKSGTGSFSVRVDDFVSGIKAWSKNLLFGNGYDDSVITSYFTVARDNMGLSMGITTTLAKGGVYLLSFYFLELILIFKNTKHKTEWFFISVIFGFEFFISNVGFSLLFIAVVSYLYAHAYMMIYTKNEKYIH